MTEQLLLFEETETERLERQVKTIKESNDKVRKRLFAEHNEMYKIILKQQQEIEELKTIVRRIGKDSIDYSFSLAI